MPIHKHGMHAQMGNETCWLLPKLTQEAVLGAPFLAVKQEQFGTLEIENTGGNVY